MRALVFNNGLHYRKDHPVPKLEQGDALIRVKLAGICNTDLEITKGYMGFQGVLGHEFVGVVEKCDEKGFIGRRVTGEINIGCGTCPNCQNHMQNHCPNRSVLGILNKEGAFAEFLTLPAGNLHVIPDSISDEEAVFVEPLAAAFEILQQVKILPTDKVCVLGDGKLGLLAGQVLSTTGCNLVVAGRHREKLKILEAIGIRTILQSPPHPNPLPPGERGPKNSPPLTGGDEGEGENEFDYVVDCTGSSSGIDAALGIVKSRGKIILKTTVAERAAVNLNQIVIGEISVIGSRCGPFPPAIEAIHERKVKLSPLVSNTFSLKDGVKAFEYAARKGVLKVLLKIS
ncbi:MAG: alcohol dehydrogenase catalytic domain-containing protein [Nitrospirae bacterium]|nr:alcohol dehydrogenase catalytic domain-containing protein [Nitrospirota bacterium]